jgi:hypothetical protein
MIDRLTQSQCNFICSQNGKSTEDKTTGTAISSNTEGFCKDLSGNLTSVFLGFSIGSGIFRNGIKVVARRIN